MQPISARPPAAPSRSRTLGALLRKRATQQPEDLAYVFAAETPGAAPCPLTYAQLDRRSRAVASYLGSVAPPGTRIMLAFPPGADFAGALFGCLLAAMVAVPLIDAHPVGVAQVERAIHMCAPRVLLAEPEWVYEWRDLERLPRSASDFRLRHTPSTAAGAPSSWDLRSTETARGAHAARHVEIIEADGLNIGKESVDWLAQRWRSIGVMAHALAYLRCDPDDAPESPFTHLDVLNTLSMLAKTAELGLDRQHIDWLAGVHGLEQVWQFLLPVYQGHALQIRVR